MGSMEDREKLKEEYKAHYRALRDLRQKAAGARRMVSVDRAMQSLQNTDLIQRFDDALHAVQENMLRAEARLEMLLEGSTTEEYEEVVERQKARETLASIRAEMGAIQEHVDEQVLRLTEVRKSLGAAPDQNKSASPSEQDGTIRKTLGPKDSL